MTLAEIAKMVGLSRRYVEMLSALLEADPAIQAEVEAGRISAKTARVLGTVSDEHQPEVARVAADLPAERYAGQTADRKSPDHR
jgi:ParB-like chromosome segregation protein Spo0J